MFRHARVITLLPCYFLRRPLSPPSPTSSFIFFLRLVYVGVARAHVTRSVRVLAGGLFSFSSENDGAISAGVHKKKNNVIKRAACSFFYVGAAVVRISYRSQQSAALPANLTWRGYAVTRERVIENMIIDGVPTV